MKEKLTKQQQEAVEYTKSPLLIVAGPGAGKTKVLIEKIVYLVEKLNMNPSKILVSTFTVKATEELKDRLRKRLGNRVENMQISTIHSFCQTMLEEFSDSHRLGASFRVLDEEEQYIFVKSNAAFKFGLKDFVRADEISELINLYNKLTENNVDPNQLISHLEREKAKEREVSIAKSYDKYLNALRIENILDFANLQKELLFVLKSYPDILRKIQNKYDYLLIDEYQDTNPIQEEIFWVIAQNKQKICVVGDEDQSIYGFRGASVENFRNFTKRYSHAKIIKLDLNFRSGKQLVKFADRFMKSHRTYPKTIKAVRGNTNNPILIKGRRLAEEAELVVNLIKKYKDGSIIKSYGDVAILFRSVRNHASFYSEYLRKANIPYYVIGDGAFLEREEVRTIIYLMALIEGFTPEDKITSFWPWWNSNLLLNRVLNLKSDTIVKIKPLLEEKNAISKFTYQLLSNLGIDKSDMFLLLRISEKRKQVVKRGSQRKKYSMTTLFYDILKITGYLRRIVDSNEENDQLQVYNLGQLSSIIYKFETTSHNNNFKHFFNHIYYLPDDKSYDCAYLENSDAVKLMTVHQAKGLEFPVVIMASVIKKRFPNIRAKIENKFFRIPGVFLMGKQHYSPLDEERRLFYVGMTRAQDLLIVATTDGGRYKSSEYIMDEIGISEFVRPESKIVKCEKTYIQSEEVPRLSYSSINNFLSCAFRYSLNYKYDFQTPPTYFQNYGTVVHNSLQRIHLDIKDGKPVDLQRIKEIATKCWIPVNFDKRKDEKLKADLVERLWNYVRKGTVSYKEILDIEKPFSFIEKHFVIRGKVDLIVKQKDDKVSILDFKSRNVEGLDTTMVDLQLRMYNFALENEYRIDALYAYTFRDNMKTQFSNKPEDLKRAKELIITVGNKVFNDEFERNINSKFCPQCLYSFLCDLRKKK